MVDFRHESLCAAALRPVPVRKRAGRYKGPRCHFTDSGNCFGINQNSAIGMDNVGCFLGSVAVGPGWPPQGLSVAVS